MSDVKVYKMNDYEWWASKWDKERTNEFYLKEYELDEEENPVEEIEEYDLDKEGMWWDTIDKQDREKLGDADELIEKMDDGSIKFGSLMRRGIEVFKFISLREALERHGDFEEPFCLASTEW